MDETSVSTRSLGIQRNALTALQGIRTRSIRGMSVLRRKLADAHATATQRIVLLDSDMIVMRNMDELMDLALPSDWIAAAHACACNPRKLAHYPPDW